MSKLSEKEIEDSKYYPSNVYLCSPTNSTMFTSCCHCAICDDQSNCPKCGKYVFGWDFGNVGAARWSMAYNKRK